MEISASILAFSSDDIWLLSFVFDPYILMSSISVFQALKLHLEFGNSNKPTTPQSGTATTQKTSALSLRSGIFASAIVITSIGVLVYLKRSKQ